MPAFARIAIFLLLLCVGSAHADSWVPPRADMRVSYHFIFVATDSQTLADALVRHLSGMKRGALQGATATLVGTPEQGQQVRAAAERSGAAVVLIDKAVPYPPGALPEEVSEWFR